MHHLIRVFSSCYPFHENGSSWPLLRPRNLSSPSVRIGALKGNFVLSSDFVASETASVTVRIGALGGDFVLSSDFFAPEKGFVTVRIGALQGKNALIPDFFAPEETFVTVRVWGMKQKSKMHPTARLALSEIAVYHSYLGRKLCALDFPCAGECDARKLFAIWTFIFFRAFDFDWKQNATMVPSVLDFVCIFWLIPKRCEIAGGSESSQRKSD